MEHERCTEGDRATVDEIDERFFPPPELCRQIVADDPYGRVGLDGAGRVRWANAAAAELVGLTVEEVVGAEVLSLIVPEDLATVLEGLEELARLDETEGIPMVFGLRHADGHTVYVEAGSSNYVDEVDLATFCLRLRPYTGQRALGRFLTQLVSAAPMHENLCLLVESVDNTIQHAESAIGYGWDGSRFADTVTTALPPLLVGAERPVGRGPEAPWVTCLRTGAPQTAPVSQLSAPVRAAAAQGGFVSCWARPVTTPNEGTVAVLVVWRRVDGPPRVGHRAGLERICDTAALAFERHRAEQLLVEAATVDPLTGIPNRAQFLAVLEQQVAVRAADADGDGLGPLAVLYLDLDNFKPVNDIHGHRFGDRVLAAVASVLTSQVRPEDMVARLGGDEFAVLCYRGVDERTVALIAERLIKAVEQPVEVDGVPVRVGLSVGVAFTDVHGPGLDALLDAADHALYTAKREGRGRWRLAQPVEDLRG